MISANPLQGSVLKHKTAVPEYENGLSRDIMDLCCSLFKG